MASCALCSTFVRFYTRNQLSSSARPAMASVEKTYTPPLRRRMRKKRKKENHSVFVYTVKNNRQRELGITRQLFFFVVSLSRLLAALLARVMRCCCNPILQAVIRMTACGKDGFPWTIFRGIAILVCRIIPSLMQPPFARTHLEQTHRRFTMTNSLSKATCAASDRFGNCGAF